MIIVLVIGLWTFLRAVLFGAATIALDNTWRCAINSAVLQRLAADPGSRAGIDSFGCGCPGLGGLAVEPRHR